MKLLSLIAGLMCGFAVITGCAGTGGIFSGDPTVEQAIAKIAIQQATLRAIQANGEAAAPIRAAVVVKVIDQTLAVLSDADSEAPDGDHVISAADLAAALDLVLPKDLAPADKLLVAQLSTLIIAEVSARIPDDQQQLPLTEISVVLGWVREAAILAAPPPAS
jgi:hypothetical protein